MNVGVIFTGPRHVPAASPFVPASATAISGALVSILKVSDFQDSRTPALSIARYSNVRVPLVVSVATASYVSHGAVVDAPADRLDARTARPSRSASRRPARRSSRSPPAVDAGTAFVTGGVPSTVNEPVR